MAQFVRKSASTAYYLLASLVEEGFATHEGGLYLPRPHDRAAAGGRTSGHGLEDAVDDLFLRTHKRCYLGVVRTGAGAQCHANANIPRALTEDVAERAVKTANREQHRGAREGGE